MNGVLGGFKNMLRQWRINLKKRKQKEKKQIETNKNLTKYPRLTSFIYSTIAIIYSPFGYIFAKDNEQANIEEPKLYKKIEKINIELDRIIIGEENNLKKLEKEIEKLKKEVTHPMSAETKTHFNNKLKELELKTNFIKNPNQISSIEAKIITSSLEKNIASKEINKPQNIDNSLLKKLSITPFVLVNESHKVKPNNNIAFIKNTNKELKEIASKTKEIEAKISTVKEYNHYHDLENDLKYLQNKLYLLKSNYRELKDKFSISIDLDFDKYKLIKSDKSIDEIIKQIDTDLKLIEIKKKEILSQKNVKQNKPKEAKKDEKKEIKKEKIKEVDEFVKAQQHILNNIANQNKYLENYLKKLSKSTNKKQTIFSSLFNFSKTILNFTISLLPTTIFKNKLLGTLVSTMMINNSIKTMRKMVNPNLHINYEYFLENYIDSKEIIANTYNICNNSLNEINLLKNELILLGATKEAKLLLEQIELIEDNIIRQMQNLKTKDQTLDKVYVKIKKNSA